jgi:hypothetical protein
VLNFLSFQFSIFTINCWLSAVSFPITCPLVPASYGRKLRIPQNFTHARTKDFCFAS